MEDRVGDGRCHPDLHEFPKLLRRVGPELSGKQVWSTDATLDEQPRIDGNAFDGSVVPVSGSDARCVGKPGTTKAGTILAQAPWGPPELAYGHTATGDPAVASIGHGSGTSSVLTWTVGRTYREFAKTEVRDHLLGIVEPLAGAEVRAELPEQVELILGRDDDGFVVHLLNQTGAHRRSFGPHLPVSGGRLVIHGTNGHEKATALVAGHDLPSRREEDTVVIDLPVINLFEVVRVRGLQ
ncbi:hypothetical protein [Amycolatopsis sp.]|uniref:hypothetical protein n=1 Tax=Amycolatopsis sp. TaxID=37632 RepID=UPI002D7FBB42|nr:hypothetical protein [Amycolatopsis sp.]HET6709691.1 hypothetical protein [Amycolatopsis sp.]